MINETESRLVALAEAVAEADCIWDRRTEGECPELFEHFEAWCCPCQAGEIVGQLRLVTP